jgi:hypothetical protein
MLLLYREERAGVRRTAVHAHGTASLGNQSDAGVIRGREEPNWCPATQHGFCRPGPAERGMSHK